MFRRSSDVAERLPLFNDMVHTVNAARAQGAYDDINPAIGVLFDAAEPAGLDKQRDIVWPRPYQPDAKPPMLMVMPGETDSFRYTWSKPLRQATAMLVERAGLDAPVPRHGRSHNVMLPSPFCVRQDMSNVRMDDKQFTLYVPRLITVPAEIELTGYMPVALAHELDHWDFYLNQATALSRDGASREEVKTMAEKRAYKTSYAVECRLGYHALLPSIEDIAEQCSGLEPQDAYGIHKVWKSAQRRVGIDRKFPSTVPALALSCLFGRPEESYVTADEVTAYKTAELI